MLESEKQLVDEVLNGAYSPSKGFKQLIDDLLSALFEKSRHDFTIYLEDSTRREHSGIENRLPLKAPFSLAKLCEAGLTDQEKSTLHPAVAKAIVYLLKNLEDKLSLDLLAQHACVSRSHLSWLFKEAVGTSPMAFLTLLRVERSRRLLMKERTLTITEIAFRSGFGDLRHFERMFKRFMNMSPREFRSTDSDALSR